MTLAIERPTNWAEFNRKGEAILRGLQPRLLPGHASAIVAIDVDTGDHYLGTTSRDALKAFAQAHPGRVAWVARVDGGPVVKFHGRR